MKKAAFYAGFVLVISSCVNAKTDPEPTFIPKLYPTEISRTASYNSDTLTSVYNYNTANQIIKEDLFLNRLPNGYVSFTYNSAGKQVRKTTFNAENEPFEQDEVTYNAQNQPVKMVHGYFDATGNVPVHHYRNYAFGADGKLSEIADYSPQSGLQTRLMYQQVSATLLKITEYDATNQFLNIREVEFDNRQNPFYATNFEVTGFPNELSRVTKDASSQPTYTIQYEISYNPEGYPVKIVQHHTGGITKTETIKYRK